MAPVGVSESSVGNADSFDRKTSFSAARVIALGKAPPLAEDCCVCVILAVSAPAS
jgi:hypothetical protein